MNFYLYFWNFSSFDDNAKKCYPKLQNLSKEWKLDFIYATMLEFAN